MMVDGSPIDPKPISHCLDSDLLWVQFPCGLEDAGKGQPSSVASAATSGTALLLWLRHARSLRENHCIHDRE